MLVIPTGDEQWSGIRREAFEVFELLGVDGMPLMELLPNVCRDNFL